MVASEGELGLAWELPAGPKGPGLALSQVIITPFMGCAVV